ncbi:SUKH-4 family immunity protein [Streptomyces asoensis]|uniref:SUKH-4 family immunity protein n=1 Tax=Streptomyces asoensis TaxID=249586 RepID=UPI003322FE6A
MGTTRTTTATMTITFTEDEPGPYVTHAPTRRPRTGRGLPGPAGDGVRPPFAALRTDLFRTDALRRDGLRTDAPRTLGDATGGPEAPGGRETAPAPLGSVAGAIPATYFLHDRPGPADLHPLAPALELLMRHASAVDELAALRGQFACYARRLGPRAVAQAAHGLPAVLEDAGGDTGDASGALRLLAAVLRPPALTAGTTSGLALDLPVRLLDDAFGFGAIVRFEDIDCPRALVHAPTRRFLREVGLPEEAVRFSLETDAPLQTLTEYLADDPMGDLAGCSTDDTDAGDRTGRRLPANADRLIRLGRLHEDTSLLVDGATGAVLCWSEQDPAPRPLSTDLSTLALTLWLIRRERALDAVHRLTEACDRLTENMGRSLAAVEPGACDPTPVPGVPAAPGVPTDGGPNA